MKFHRLLTVVFSDKPLEYTRFYDKPLTFILSSRDAPGWNLGPEDGHPYKLQLKYRRELNIKHFSLLVCQLERVRRAQKQLPERMPRASSQGNHFVV